MGRKRAAPSPGPTPQPPAPAPACRRRRRPARCGPRFARRLRSSRWHSGLPEGRDHPGRHSRHRPRCDRSALPERDQQPRRQPRAVTATVARGSMPNARSCRCGRSNAVRGNADAIELSVLTDATIGFVIATGPLDGSGLLVHRWRQGLHCTDRPLRARCCVRLRMERQAAEPTSEDQRRDHRHDRWLHAARCRPGRRGILHGRSPDRMAGVLVRQCDRWSTPRWVRPTRMSRPRWGLSEDGVGHCPGFALLPGGARFILGGRWPTYVEGAIRSLDESREELVRQQPAPRRETIRASR